MTAVLLYRLTHHCHVFETYGESYRFRQSRKTKKKSQPRKGQQECRATRVGQLSLHDR